MLAFNGRAKFRKFSRASKGTEGSSRKLREFETGRARREKEGRSEDIERSFSGRSLPSLFGYGKKRRASLRRTMSWRGRVTTRVPRESASRTRWLCISLALNIAEAKVVPASLYGPLPPTTSQRLFLFLSHFLIPTSLFSSLHTYLRHYDISPFVLPLSFPPILHTDDRAFPKFLHPRSISFRHRKCLPELHDIQKALNDNHHHHYH